MSIQKVLPTKALCARVSSPSPQEGGTLNGAPGRRVRAATAAASALLSLLLLLLLTAEPLVVLLLLLLLL